MKARDWMRKLVHVSLLTAVAVLTAGHLDAACGSWDWANPRPQGNHLRAVAYGDGTLVTIGDRGALLRGADGAHWAIPPQLTSEDLYDVAWTDLGFVVVGDRGTVLMSPDGIDWEIVDIGTFQDLRTVVWNGSRLLIAADGTPVITTLDTTIWEITEIDPMDPVAMVWGNGQYVAITDHEILVSGDGLTWSEVASSDDEAFFDIAFDSGTFVVSGEGGLVWLSDDTETWTAEDTGTSRDLYAVDIDGEFLLAVGRSGIVLTSLNGGSWDRWESNTNLDLLALVLGGDVGYVSVGANGGSVTSPFGREWDAHSSFFPRDDLVEVAWTGSRFVALSGRSAAKAGSDFFFTETGVDWVEASLAGSHQFLAMSCGPSSCVAVGDDRAAVSADGTEWEAATLFDVDLEGVAWQGGLYVAVGSRFSDGAVMNSVDGFEWTDVTPADSPVLHDVAASPFIWVAVGEQGTIMASVSGSHWTPRELDTPKAVLAVAWTGSRFIAVGERSLIAVSDDGEQWAVLPSPRSRSAAKDGVTKFLDVARVGDGVLIVGEEGAMLTSEDGIAWSWREYSTLLALEGIVWNGEQELIVGQAGITLRRQCPPRVRTPGGRQP